MTRQKLVLGWRPKVGWFCWASAGEGDGVAGPGDDAGDGGSGGEQQAAGELQQGEQQVAGEGDGAAEPQPVKPVKSDSGQNAEWWQRRINKLTAKTKALEEENTTLKQRTVEPTPGQQPLPGLTPGSPEYQAAVRAEAEQLHAADQFNQQCANIAEAGKEAFGEDQFNRSVSQLVSMIDRTDGGEVAQYRSLIEAAISTGEAARIVHLLGSDLNEAARIMALPPARMGVELAKMAMVQPDRTTTSAPRPASVPRGSGGGSAPHTAIDPTDPERSDRLSTAEWMKRREEQSNRWDNRPRGGR